MNLWISYLKALTPWYNDLHVHGLNNICLNSFEEEYLVSLAVGENYWSFLISMRTSDILELRSVNS
jgi:hypothetical protein